MLADTITTIEQAGVPYLVIGGIPSAEWGGTGKDIRDVDILIPEHHAERVLSLLAERGFSTERAENWLSKARRDGILVDLIFSVKGNIRMDDEMVARGIHHDVRGQTMRLASPEDLVVMLASSDKEDTTYWYSALRVLERQHIDWNYLSRRARSSVLRVTSLLLYALSEDIAVPVDVIADLCTRVSGIRQEGA